MKLSSTAFWSFLVFPLLLLVAVIALQWRSIERTVAKNVSAQLQSDQPWARVETFSRGRDVLITGEAPDSVAIEASVALASQIEGVRRVNFVGDLAVRGVQPASVNIASADDLVVISGTLNSVEAIDQMISSARAALGDTPIRNRLTKADNVDDFPNLGGVFNAFQEIDEQASVALEDNQLVIGGIVTSPDERALVERLAQENFALPIINRLRVVAPPCQDTIRELLDGSEIKFASGEATINSSSNPLIEQIAGAATECQASLFEVVGHADEIGSEEFNLQLSQQRADAVVEKLAAFGIDRERFTTRGAGTSEPVADNATAAGRANNRRIEFRVTN